MSDPKRDMEIYCDNEEWSGPAAWDILLLRLFKDPDGPLFWKKCGACAVVPCMGSWSAHTSSSASDRRIEPVGFDKVGNKLCQEGTRRWMVEDKKRHLVGFLDWSDSTRPRGRRSGEPLQGRALA